MVVERYRRASQGSTGHIGMVIMRGILTTIRYGRAAWDHRIHTKPSQHYANILNELQPSFMFLVPIGTTVTNVAFVGSTSSVVM